MILSIVRTALVSLRRDSGALALSFILPIAFFSIFAVIFGGHRGSTSRINVIVADEDHSTGSQRLIKALEKEGALAILRAPASKEGVVQPDYTAATAEAAVKTGVAPIALVVPKGYGAHPIAIGPGSEAAHIRMLKDSSDQIAPQMVGGLLQKASMTAMPDMMMEEGFRSLDGAVGGFTPQQRSAMQDNLKRLRAYQQRQEAGGGNASGQGGMSEIVHIDATDVVGSKKDAPMISFYAAAIGVMFLLFTAGGAAGALLDEADNGTLDRILSSRMNMTTLLAGKLAFSVLLAFSQLVLMFVWAWAVFQLDLWTHIPGFMVMGLCTSFAVGAFGTLLASVCKTRAQLGSLSTLVILMMSSIGGSMFPRYLMPEAIQKAGLLTINAWAIDGFTKVFWRDEPLSHLWPQVAVLVGVGVVLFAIARRVARKWEYS